MTAILAARTSDGILIGSDRCWSNGTLVFRCGPKVIPLSGGWWLGVAGSAACDWDALRGTSIKVPSDLDAHLGEHAAALLIRGKSIRFGQPLGGRAWEWGLVKGDTAIGSGAPHVLSAWDALAGYESDPEKRMRRALQITARRCPDVAGPFDVIRV